MDEWFYVRRCKKKKNDEIGNFWDLSRSVRLGLLRSELTYLLTYLLVERKTDEDSVKH